MTKPGINLQDSFLNQMRKDNAPIQLVMLDGSRLSGHVRGFDNFTIVVQSGNEQHLVYKHAVSQITHQREASRPLFREPQEAAPEFARPAPKAAIPSRAPRVASPPTSEAEPPRKPQPPPSAPLADAPAKPAPAKPAPGGEKVKFNTIDLSDVKIDA
jgi:host factor-I protein